jgi:2,4-didehydro-3-deoxy-L-rhamnonate hydrolase
MRLLRVGEPGAERPAVEDGDGVHDIGAVTPDLNGDFFAGDGIRRVREALSTGQLPGIDVAGRRIGPPIARPTAVLCIGQNYAAHAAESGDPPPKFPIFFFKHPNTRPSYRPPWPPRPVRFASGPRRGERSAGAASRGPR